MNLKKTTMSCMVAVLLLGNFSYVHALKESKVNFISLIKTAVDIGTPIHISYSVSAISRQYLYDFLFQDDNWYSIPEEIRDRFIYNVGFDFQGLSFNISETGIDGKEIFDFTPSLCKTFQREDAIIHINKIIKYIPISKDN